MAEAPSSPVAILLYEGASAHQALGALAALHAAGWPAELVSADALVATREGARIVPTRLGYATVESAPAAVVPGGDARRALTDAALVRALRARRGRPTLAAGEAVHLLAAAGLTDERRVARLPGEPDVARATNVAARLVADGRVLTSFGGDPLVDLVLHHVAQESGAQVAQRAAQRLGRDFQPFALGAGERED